MAFQIADQDTPDPFMIKFQDKYILTFTSGGDKVELWSSPYLHNFHDNVTTSRIIWRQTPDLHDIWAPEIHIADNTWYIYFAGAKSGHGNESHRMYALRGPPSTTDPMSPTSTFQLDKIIGLPDDKWAIDGTVFTLNNQLYMVYSGWPLDPRDSHATDENMQQLLITRMTGPITSDGDVRMISMADQEWEKYTEPSGRQRFINEGPQWLEMGGFKGIVYSCGASWSPAPYLLGMLQYTGGNPLDKRSWRKWGPWLEDDRKRGIGPYSPGHCSFVPSPDAKQTWIVFHATPTDHENAWNNRKGWVQPVVTTNGLPDAGKHPFVAGIYSLPSGTPVSSIKQNSSSTTGQQATSANNPTQGVHRVATAEETVGIIVQKEGGKISGIFNKIRSSVKRGIKKIGGNKAK